MSMDDQKQPPGEGQVPLAQKLNLETAQITWKELEPYFAGGKVISVSSTLDMLLVAEQIVADNTAQMKSWMDAELVGRVTDVQAINWSESNALLWAVVIKPWVLVQDR